MPADYGHVVHRGAEGETTEWDDIHARLGNAPPRASPRAPPAPFAPRAEEEDEAREIAAAPSRSVATARVDALGADALEEMEDDDAFADDAFLETYRCATRRDDDATRRERRRPGGEGADAERTTHPSVRRSTVASSFCTLVPIRPRRRGERRFLRTFPGASLRPSPRFQSADPPSSSSLLPPPPPPAHAARRERLAELKASASVPRFGAVRDIARDAFLSEVTDASSSHHVVVLMCVVEFHTGPPSYDPVRDVNAVPRGLDFRISRRRSSPARLTDASPIVASPSGTAPAGTASRAKRSRRRWTSSPRSTRGPNS